MPLPYVMVHNMGINAGMLRKKGKLPVAVKGFALREEPGDFSFNKANPPEISPEGLLHTYLLLHP